jgi:spore coat polysaccharide biosynthesis protein SpsF
MDIKKLNIIAIIQARMGSTRLPGKVMEQIVGRPLLDIQLERIKRSSRINSIIVATTDQPQDAPIHDYCLNHGVVCFRGDEDNVLKRFHDVACAVNADAIIRMTADCPLIDPQIMDQTINCYLEHYPKYDYVSNVHPRTYPRGMDVEIFSIRALNEAYKNAHTPYELEHVTPYIIKHATKANVAQQKDQSAYRLTVDTPEDFEVVRLIFTALYPHNPHFNLEDIVSYMDDNPSIGKINAEIKQKQE